MYFEGYNGYDLSSPCIIYVIEKETATYLGDMFKTVVDTCPTSPDM